MISSRRSSGQWTASSLIEGLVLILGAWYILAYVAIALVRLRYPFELEWMEGAIVDQVRHVAAGHRLYVQPSIDFIPFQYPPLYFYVGALMASIVGAHFLTLRLLSFLASLGCFATMFAMVRRESGSGKAGFLAVSLFAACFRAAGAWYDLARIDSLCLLLVLSGAYVVRFGASRRDAILAAVLLALASLTKQSALVIALPLLGYLVAESWREGILAVVAFATFVGGATWALNRIHHGWYLYYVFVMPARMQRVDSISVDFWRHDILAPLAVAFALSLVYMLAGITRAATVRSWFYPSFAVALIGTAWLSMRHAGAYDNNLIPAYAVISILLGLAVAEMNFRASAGVLAVIQLLLLFYDPRQQVPTSRSREAGRHLVALIAAAPGDVLLPQHGYLSAFADKRTFAHSMAVYDVMRAGDPGDGARLAGQFQQAFANQQFGLVIVDRVDPWIRDGLAKAYRPAGPAIDAPDAFWPVTGLHIRPEQLYVPKSR